MEITCSFCETSFEFPDERLPEAKKFKLNCPKCREPLLIEQNSEHGQMIAPEAFPHDATVALMYVPDNELAERIGDFLKSKGIYISEAQTVTVALEKMRINYYQMLILEENDASQAILNATRKWDGLRRRDINVVYLNTDTQSMQQSEAFFRGVNFVIGKSDVKRVEQFLEIILKEYKDYKEMWVLAEKKARMGG